MKPEILANKYVNSSLLDYAIELDIPTILLEQVTGEAHRYKFTSDLHLSTFKYKVYERRHGQVLAVVPIYV